RKTLTPAMLALLIAPTSASAHPEGFSGLRVQILPDKAHAILTLHTRDLTAWFPPGKFPNYVPDVSRELTHDPNDLLEFQADESPIVPANARTSLPEVGLIQIDIDYPWKSRPASVQFWSRH